MKRFFLFLIPIILAIGVFVGIVFFIQKQSNAKGALQVTSVPQATVLLNNKEIGKTPLCKCEGADMLEAGDYTIKLIPSDATLAPYEEKITITPSVLTVVDRTFGDIGKSSGSIITLSPLSDKKQIELSVSSFPIGADVLLDNNNSGQTPATVQNITESDHELTVQKAGYKAKTIRIHTVAGYKLEATLTLATDLSVPSITVMPTASPTAAVVPQVTILDTPTGFLRVRDNPSLGGAEVTQIKPGETYPLVSEQDGWFQISLPNGEKGWISASYAKKI